MSGRNPDTVEFSIRLPRIMHKQLAQVAGREYSSLNREIVIAVRAHLDRDKQTRGQR